MELTQEQIDAFPFGDFEKQHYLGDLHWYSFISCGEHCEGEGKHGIIQPHYDMVRNRWCAGACPFKGHDKDSHTWTAESLEPLTLSPSLLCRWPLEGGGECGDHGFIRQGKWVKA